MECVIIAAGRGSRLKTRGTTKPLTPLVGIPLVERVVLSAGQAGVDAFVVVTGFDRERVELFLRSLAERTGLPITPLFNELWEQANGLSVLAARDVIRDRFLLTMCDHLFDPGIVSDLLKQPLGENEVILGVDSRLSNPMVDLDDVTRVRTTPDGLIRNAGKGIEPYTAFDTGLFFCTPALFGAIEESSVQSGDTSLTGGLNVLAGRGRARYFDIGDRFWLDVDGPAEFDLAERLAGEGALEKILPAG